MSVQLTLLMQQVTLGLLRGALASPATRRKHDRRLCKELISQNHASNWTTVGRRTQLKTTVLTENRTCAARNAAHSSSSTPALRLPSANVHNNCGTPAVCSTTRQNEQVLPQLPTYIAVHFATVQPAADRLAARYKLALGQQTTVVHVKSVQLKAWRHLRLLNGKMSYILRW
jgi:hypothetical protein